MAELLEDVDQAFASDPAIDEIGIIMSPPPPNIVLVEHKLGLSYKILKPLFAYAISEFYSLLTAIKHGEKNLSEPLVADRMMRLTRATLLVKGDMPMFYNVRKQILRGGSDVVASKIAGELSFIALLFTKHPKSPSTWQHRRWCLNERHLVNLREGDLSNDYNSGRDIIDSDNQLNKIADSEHTVSENSSSCFHSREVDSILHLSTSDLKVELDLCSWMSETYPKNYYSWMHRLWLLQFMNIELLEGEMAFTKAWLTSHVSDHSAMSHRQQIVLRILSVISTYEHDLNNKNDWQITDQSKSARDPINIVIPKQDQLQKFLIRRAEILMMKFDPRFMTACHSSNINIMNPDKSHLRVNWIIDDNNVYYQLLFMETVLRESRLLILQRPGNETLWCLLRATATLMLGRALHLFKEKKHKNNKEKEEHVIDDKRNNLLNDNGEKPCRSIGSCYEGSAEAWSTLSTDDFAISLDPKNNVDPHFEDNESDVNSFILPPSLPHLKSGKSINYEYNFTFLISTMLKLQQRTLDFNNDNTSFLNWVIEWLKNEKLFCQNCIDNTDAWNYSIHRQMSLRYYSFLLHWMSKYVTTNVFHLDGGEITRNSDCQNNENNENNKNNETNEDNERHKNEEENGADTVEDCFQGRLKSFLCCLAEAQGVVCRQLEAEGWAHRRYLHQHN